MKFTNSYATLNLFAFFLTLFSFLGSFAVQAAPLAEKRDVFVPAITSPTEGTVWSVGETHVVTWDVSDPPAQITNGNGLIFLRKGDLTTPLVLAGNFNILDGQATITVPSVVEGDDYALVLFGDSGNFSPTITIQSPFNF